MSKMLGIYVFVRNAFYYDYPIFESIKSYLPIADQIVICECYSDKDDTWGELEKFALDQPKIKLIRHEWIKHHSELAGIANSCIPHLTTDWKWQIQADEVLHENNYDKILSAINNAPAEVTALKTNYTHFMANYETEFDFCYRNITRIARKNSGWWLVGDACQLDKKFYNKEEVLDTDIMVYHYGKVHQGEVGFRKEIDFQNLYTDLGFPDPKMKQMQEKLGHDYCDYLFLFEEAIRLGKVRQYKGTHPAVMKDRIELFKLNGWDQFNSKIKEGLKLQN